MRIRIEFKSQYREMHCTFCNRRIHTASDYLPSWVSEHIGKAKSWLHRRSVEHKQNRPSPGLAPALELDTEAFERRWSESQASQIEDDICGVEWDDRDDPTIERGGGYSCELVYGHEGQHQYRDERWTK